MDSLTIMWERINALRRIYQRTRNNEELSENRKYKYLEGKKKYQYEIREEKFNSWKEYCNVPASSNPWSQAYKLATGKLRSNSIMTTLRKRDGSDIKYTRDDEYNARSSHRRRWRRRRNSLP